MDNIDVALEFRDKIVSNPLIKSIYLDLYSRECEVNVFTEYLSSNERFLIEDAFLAIAYREFGLNNGRINIYQPDDFVSESAKVGRVIWSAMEEA